MKDGGSAFPVVMTSDPGMSRRQWLAGLAMQGMCANPAYSGSDSASLIARLAHAQADAMIEYEDSEPYQNGHELAVLENSKMAISGRSRR